MEILAYIVLACGGVAVWEFTVSETPSHTAPKHIRHAAGWIALILYAVALWIVTRHG